MISRTANIFTRATTALVVLVGFAFARGATAAGTSLINPEPPSAGRMEAAPDELKGIKVDEHLGAQLPMDATFVDETNQPVTLGQYFGGKKPVVVQLGYYGCPMLCDYVSRGLTTSLKSLPLNAAVDYDVIFISIDPTETWQLAQNKKRSFVREYDRTGTAGGWHFLTGGREQIARVSSVVGFNYKWVPSVGQFSHPAAIAVCSPAGKLMRYLYGVQFKEETLRLSLVEASQGKIGTTTDHFLLTCFQFDGTQGKYAFAAMSLMRYGGVATAVTLGWVLIRLFRRDARRRQSEETDAGAPAA